LSTKISKRPFLAQAFSGRGQKPESIALKKLRLLAVAFKEKHCFLRQNGYIIGFYLKKRIFLPLMQIILKY